MGILTFDITCPHCLRENAVLEGWAELRINAEPLVNVAFSCRSCFQAGIAIVKMNNPGGYLPRAKSRQNNDVNVIIPGNAEYQLVDIFPKPVTLSAPDHTPHRAAMAFVEAKDNLGRGRFDTSVMLCRKVLDIATRELLGNDSKDEKLVKRISMLHGKGLITDQMKEWAHIVRIDSNGAVHSDEEFSKEDAQEMIGFTEVFLLYAFTLPDMVENKKQNQ